MGENQRAVRAAGRVEHGATDLVHLDRIYARSFIFHPPLRHHGRPVSVPENVIVTFVPAQRDQLHEGAVLDVEHLESDVPRAHFAVPGGGAIPAAATVQRNPLGIRAPFCSERQLGAWAGG